MVRKGKLSCYFCDRQLGYRETWSFISMEQQILHWDLYRHGIHLLKGACIQVIMEFINEKTRENIKQIKQSREHALPLVGRTSLQLQREIRTLARALFIKQWDPFIFPSIPGPDRLQKVLYSFKKYWCLEHCFHKIESLLLSGYFAGIV